jgi:hypothetical protein
VSNDSTSEGAALLTVLGDEYVQEILVATSDDPKSAKELSEELDAAMSTVYDRTEDMVEHRLLLEGTNIRSDGSHHSVFEANVDHLDIDIVDGELVVDVHTKESPAERFTSVWNDIRRA